MNTAATAVRRRFLLGACALACCAAASASGAWGWDHGDQVQGNGRLTRQNRDLAAFRGVSLSLPGDVEVRRGERSGLVIETDDNLLPLIETVVEDGTLKIRNKRGTALRTRHLRITVQTRELDHLAVGGPGDIDADRLDGAQVRIDIGGSGDVKVGRIEAERVTVNLGGSGDLKAREGNARSLSLDIAGSGDVDFARVRAGSAEVSVAGSGDAALWVRDSLGVTVAGSGDVSYYGDPKVSKSVMGSGEVRRLGAAPR